MSNNPPNQLELGLRTETKTSRLRIFLSKLLEAKGKNVRPEDVEVTQTRVIGGSPDLPKYYHVNGIPIGMGDNIYDAVKFDDKE